MSKLNKAILLRLTDEDHETLTNRAKEKRMSVSGYIRTELLNN
jgi:predicted HicB family RNase H-like nuclease